MSRGADWPAGCRCPPGHGDIYPSLLGSSFLDSLLQEGIKYLFVSNSDNLGATLDLDLLAYFAGSGKAFLMEVSRLAAVTRGNAGCRGMQQGQQGPLKPEDKYGWPKTNRCPAAGQA